MRCGEECFFVQLDINGDIHTKLVKARTPAEARKIIRNSFGEKNLILSVRKQHQPRSPL